MFENYKKQSEDDSRYERIGYAVIAAFIFIPVFIFVFGFYEPDRPQTHTISLPVEASKRQSAEDICASLPKPEKFNLTGKSEPVNDYERHRVIYDYQSPRRPEEIMPTFLFWFSENGWRSVPNSKNVFRKDNFSIYIGYDSEASMNVYKIHCTEKANW